MTQYPQMIGDTYGRLKVMSFHGKKGTRKTWLCLCECGNTHIASTSDLRYGGVQSCGCMLSGVTSANAKHGNSSRVSGMSKTYNSWRGMVSRCGNPKQAHYNRYGGRGIRVCEQWLNFENFLADMGERPPGLTLERKDNDGNYEPSNCKWATTVEQRHNRRDSRKNLTANDNKKEPQDAAA